MDTYTFKVESAKSPYQAYEIQANSEVDAKNKLLAIYPGYTWELIKTNHKTTDKEL